MKPTWSESTTQPHQNSLERLAEWGGKAQECHKTEAQRLNSKIFSLLKENKFLNDQYSRLSKQNSDLQKENRALKIKISRGKL